MSDNHEHESSGNALTDPPAIPNEQAANEKARRLTDAGDQMPRTQRPPVARTLYDQLFLPIELQQTYWVAVNGVLRNASLAYRIDRTLQRMMRADASLMAPWYSVQMAFAMSPWKVVPRDRNDGVQEEVAKQITGMLEDIPSFTDYLIWLSEGLWYGRSAVINRFKRDGDKTVVDGWDPIHGDTLCTNLQGRLGLKTGSKYTSQAAVFTPGPESLVHMISDLEREAMVFCRFRPTGPDFYEGLEAEYAYLGKGLRDVCWFTWKLKQHVQQCWGIYAQRYGMGIRKAFYRDGSDEARSAMESAAANTMGDSTMLIPDDGISVRRANDIEVHEPSSATADTFMSLVGRLEAKLKEMIAGQLASSEHALGGLGSSVATEHARTKADHVDYLATVVGEAITRDLIKPLVRMNWGDDVPTPRFKFMVRRPQPEKYADAVQRVLEMGGEIAQDDVYEFLGIRQPDGSEPTFTRPEPEEIKLPQHIRQ